MVRRGRGFPISTIPLSGKVALRWAVVIYQSANDPFIKKAAGVKRNAGKM
jgi:hypothetical protein